MATHHSKTGRAKSSNDKIVVPSWDSVWESFKDSSILTTIEEMNEQGWKTIQQASQMIGLSRPHINAMAVNGKFERVKRKVWHSGKSREINFVRPKAL
jgi:hypothetical protein